MWRCSFDPRYTLSPLYGVYRARLLTGLLQAGHTLLFKWLFLALGCPRLNDLLPDGPEYQSEDQEPQEDQPNDLIGGHTANIPCRVALTIIRLAQARHSGHRVAGTTFTRPVWVRTGDIEFCSPLWFEHCPQVSFLI